MTKRLQGLARNQFARALSGTFLLNALYHVLGMLVGIVLARALGPDGFGIYALAISVVTLAAMPSTSGVPTLLLREVARAKASMDDRALWSALIWAGSSVAVLSLIAACALSVWFLAFDAGSIRDVSLIITLIIPLSAANTLRSALLRGLGRPVLAQIPDMLVRPLLHLLITIAVWYFFSLTARQALEIYLYSTLASLVLGWTIVVRSAPAKPRGRLEIPWRRWFQTLIPFTLLSGAQVLNVRSSLLVLGVTSSSSEVGIFRAAEQLASIVSFGMTTLMLVITPTAAALFHRKDEHDLQQLSKTAARLALAYSFATMLFIVLFGNAILNLLFGAEYRDSATTLSIMSLSNVLLSFSVSGIPLLNMSGNEKSSSLIFIVAAATNIIMSFLLSPLYGAIGAAVAVLGSSTVVSVGVSIIAYRATGVRTTPF
jgi:O-antigen/teichoic acid export membrane protein